MITADIRDLLTENISNLTCYFRVVNTFFIYRSDNANIKTGDTIISARRQHCITRVFDIWHSKRPKLHFLQRPKNVGKKLP